MRLFRIERKNHERNTTSRSGSLTLVLATPASGFDTNCLLRFTQLSGRYRADGAARAAVWQRVHGAGDPQETVVCARRLRGR